MGPDRQEWSRRHLREQEVMEDNTIVRLWFTIGGLFVILVALIIGGVQLHEYQETMKMEACVKAGKEWVKVTVDKDYAPDRACITKVDNK